MNSSKIGTKRLRRREGTPWWVWLIAIVIIIIVIVVFVASFGTIDVEARLPQEFKDSKDEALKKHKALLEELNKKQTLKDKLTRRFWWVYLAVRIGIVILCVGSVFYLGYFLGAKTLEDYLNYYEASIIALFAMNFIAFGTIANFHDFIHLLKTRVENWVWMKNINLPEEIASMKTEIAVLKKEIEWREN